MMNSLPFSPHTTACPCSGPEKESDSTGRLEITCLKCKASIIVTAHAAYQRRSLTNQFTIKKSMHKQTCSLSMEPAKKATMRRMRNASSQPSRARS
jgi:hypothetical protein